MARQKASKDAVSDQEGERKIIRYLLSSIFADAAARGHDISPDDAIKELRHRLSEIVAEVGEAPNWGRLVEAGLDIFPKEGLRWAHHLAVDLYYDVHFGKEAATGVPRHSNLHLMLIAARKYSGKSLKEIADELGLPTKKLADRLTSLDRVKKQVDAARERFPHLTPPAEGKKGG